jgi:hypothetical protein
MTMTIKKSKKATAKKESPQKKKKVDNRPVSGGRKESFLSSVAQAEGKKFILTCAQNNTEVNTEFLAALKTYCRAESAQLLIGQSLYNKAGFQNLTGDSAEIWFAPELKEFFSLEPLALCKGLIWAGEFNALPTVRNPLTGLDSYAGKSSVIVPHATQNIKSCDSLQVVDIPKLIYSTGSVTLRNTIKKRAGQIADLAHCYGALIVEVGEDGVWFARHIKATPCGSFQDLNTIYHPDGTTYAASVTAISLGDIHSEFLVEHTSFLTQICGLLNQLDPATVFLHDLSDFRSRNHHQKNSVIWRAITNNRTVQDDLQDCADVLEILSAPGRDLVVVNSNHDNALETWLESVDYKPHYDPKNAQFYHELQARRYCLADKNPLSSVDILKFALESVAGFEVQATFLQPCESYKLHGVEFGHHGHVGNGGARGSVASFVSLAEPCVIGHSHKLTVSHNVWQGGVCGAANFNHGYNKKGGGSAWSHSHIILYSTGACAAITMRLVGGEWCYRV